MSEALVYNPFSYAMHEDPYPTYARMRDEAPVVMLIGAANHDPRRLEARIALEETCRRIPDFFVEESGVSVVHAGNVAGLATLPIRFTATAPISGTGLVEPD